ncbi:single-stranded nucleic acid binding r3h protein [Arabis alpina]|uniref:Single-stranded nucleic acid binding r3h protein n=1 Tax=Arabis alpina TaxID=50452 RepID=A0A087HJL8_ARAAL|nr:single-stranded nucleic acid binding r3h protein [Arabis alpina]
MDKSLSAETACPVMADTVDPFLVEALQNPRQRLTILRMEFDIQRFLQSSDQQQFEFQHFPTSYLRLAAHRVANHYGLITLVQDSGVDGNGSRILVSKAAESRFPAVRLSEIPAKQSEVGKFEHMKIAIKPRPSKGMESGYLEKKSGALRSVEERKDDYDKARARIFNSLENLSCNDSSSETNARMMNCSPSIDENQVLKNGNIEADKNLIPRESIPASRVAIIRDREKDRYDPDYNRSNYVRYNRNLPIEQNFGFPHFNNQNMGTPFYGTGFSGYSQNPNAPPALNFGPHSVMSPYVTMGLNQPSRDAAMYMQWPNAAAMMYTHSYEHFRNAPFQAQFCPQPLSFDYMQNR